MSQIREEFDVRPYLDAGIWGDRLRRQILDDLQCKYGQVTNVHLRQRYPYVTVTALRSGEMQGQTPNPARWGDGMSDLACNHIEIIHDLEAEITRMNKRYVELDELDDLRMNHGRLRVENTRLQAEVERLKDEIDTYDELITEWRQKATEAVVRAVGEQTVAAIREALEKASRELCDNTEAWMSWWQHRFQNVDLNDLCTVCGHIREWWVHSDA